MRILWVKVGGLWPVNTGGRRRSFQILSELARRHRVVLLTTHAPGEDPRPLSSALAACEAVHAVPYSIPKMGSARFAASLARSWFSPYPVDLWKCRVPALREKAQEVLANTEVDVCVADFLAAAPNLPADPGTPVVLFEHNVEHQIWRRLCALCRGPRRADGRRHRLLRAAGDPPAPLLPRLQRGDGLVPQRGRHPPLHRDHASAHPPGGARGLADRGRTKPDGAAASRRGSSRGARHRDGGRRAPQHRRGRGVRGAAPDRRRHAAEDLRGAGDGKAGRLHRRRGRGPPPLYGPAPVTGGRTGGLRTGGRLALAASRRAAGARRSGPPAGRGAVLLDASRPQLRGAACGGGGSCELASSVSGTSAP